jgi:serine/threonine protein kinase/formylglycine-generating enzyme required for sulfatase activity
VSRERHRRIAELFRAACELDASARIAYLARECDDDAMRAEVLDLLAHDSRPHPGLSESGQQRGALIDKALRAADSGEGEAPPERIGPYKLLEKIGEGGMGEVHAADQLQPVRRRVALKLIKRGMDSAQVVARFEAERQALARMSHPNVAQVFDGGTSDDGRPYFVMEYVAGEPITGHCDRRKLSTRERIELFLAVCEGVQHAHQKGLVHRDLKPSNLLVTEQEGRASPKVIDFGVARATTGQLVDRTLHTMAGQVVGTLDYMSPEQADPTGADIDTRSDIYSLGVVLYELVSGLLPFDFGRRTDQPLSMAQRAIRELDPPTPSTRLRKQSATATAIATRHGTDERSLVRQLHGDLDWICLKALEKDPARRYASASELADDLRRHLAHEPVLAGRPGALYRARKFVRRHRVGVATGVVVVAALSTAAVGVISGRLEAARKGEELLRLSDGVALDRLVSQAEGSELWPAHPDRIDAMTDWLARARALTANLPDHRRMLDAMRDRASRTTEDGTGPTWRFDSDDDQWQHDQLAELVGGLEALETGLMAEDAFVPDHGWSVPKRLARAQELAAAFAPGGAWADAWGEALPPIREHYPDLQDLAPQAGLLPLGPDPDSGLWEFAHLMSGDPARRDADGRLVVTGETGLVLVLLPGGEFLMGSQTTDEDGDNYLGESAREGRPSDAWEYEVPVHPVTLSPFFMSKYEMTQGQWERLVGENPARPGRLALKPPVEVEAEAELAPDRPVNVVSWRACTDVTARHGLVLPSEEEWEYAARGGTDSPWWTGDDRDDVRRVGHANLMPDSRLDDGEPGLAPVTSEAPNPFGLVGVLGNVSEWTSTETHYYGRPPGVGGPLAQSNRYVGRGSSFAGNPQEARSGFRRNRGGEGFTVEMLGLRPARPVER